MLKLFPTMNTRVIGVAMLLYLSVPAIAQDRFFTKSGKISFVSKGNIETISAKHKSVTCVLDSRSGMVQYAVLMKGFEFVKALMQEHFNENYVESDTYPKADFKGQVVNNDDIKYGQDGKYPARVKGTLTLHGVSKEIEVPGSIVIVGGRPQLNASFTILLSDYQIKIPALVRENISNTVTIMVDCLLEPLKN